METLEQLAWRTAFHTHHQQATVRTFSEKSVMSFLGEVVALLRNIPHTPEMLAAAWLQNVHFAGGPQIQALRLQFGETVAQLVQQVSCPAGIQYSEDADECQRLGTISPVAQSLKLAQLIVNTSTIIEDDEAFARIYIPRSAAVLDALENGHSALQDMAKRNLVRNILALNATAWGRQQTLRIA